MSDIPSIVRYSTPLEQAEAPKPLPKQKYKATIKGATAKQSAKGTAYAEVMFFIGPDQYPADYTDGNPDGTTIAYRRVSLEDNPSARWQTRLFLEAIGAPMGGEINLDDWQHREALVEIDHESYENQPRAVIKRVMKA